MESATSLTWLDDGHAAEAVTSLDAATALAPAETPALPAAERQEPAVPARVTKSDAIAHRLGALDAFRGLTILGMLLVNNIALDTATPPHLRHAMWNEGVHFADLVLPWFLMIMGVAIPYAFAAFKRKGLAGWRQDLRVGGRAATLVALGCLIDSSLARRPMFDMGVLQILGLSYLVGALLCELPVRRRLTLAGALLIAHWAAIRFVPLPGVGSGVFTEGTNFIRHLNQIYLQPLHLGGLISVVPTSALVLIGTAVGDMLRREGYAPMQKAAYVLSGGVVMLVSGLLWNLDLPFNKPVWTSSYIVYSAGWGAIALGLLYLLIDVNGWRAWALPLIVPGVNAITAYVVPILVKIYIFQQWTWKQPDGSLLPLDQSFMHWAFAHFGRYAGGWVYTVGYIVFWWLILLWMYRKRLFIRV
jgi:predicted acyltransferase